MTRKSFLKSSCFGDTGVAKKKKLKKVETDEKNHPDQNTKKREGPADMIL